MRKGRRFFLKLLVCQDDAPIEQYFPKAAFFKDNQVHFWHLSRAPWFICTPKYLSGCTHDMQWIIWISYSFYRYKDYKWNNALFMLCHTHTNGTKTKSLECAFPKRDWECVHLGSAVSFSPLTLRKVLRNLLKALSSQIRSLLKRLCLQILPKKY